MPHNETYVNGVWHPSVTTVMGSKPKPWVDKWKERWGARADRKSQLAMAIGTEVHRCIEAFIKTGEYTIQAPTDEAGRTYPSLMRRVRGMMRSFEAWAARSHGVITETEKKVISRVHVYSGTVDAIGKISKDALGLEDGR